MPAKKRPPANPEPAEPQESDLPPAPGSGRASAAESQTASASSFVDDAGPEFDPEQAGAEMPPPEPEGPALEEELLSWAEGTVESILTGKGKLLHTAAGVAEQDWAYTEDDLEQIVPAVTRLCNRYIPHLARYADPAVIAAAMMSYATRSLAERRQVLATQEADGGTREIPPAPPEQAFATEAPTATPAAPAAQPPRAAASFPTPTSGPTAPPPAEGNEPAPQPAPAAVDPTAVEWEVGA